MDAKKNDKRLTDDIKKVNGTTINFNSDHVMEYYYDDYNYDDYDYNDYEDILDLNFFKVQDEEKIVFKKLQKAKGKNKEFSDFLKTLRMANIKKTRLMIKRILLEIDDILKEETAKMLKEWYYYLLLGITEKYFLVLGLIIYLLGNCH